MDRAVQEDLGNQVQPARQNIINNEKTKKMNLLFDFNVDRDTNTLTLTREFAADLDLVWDAFTKADILEQWVAPKPYRLETKEMDFREGGRWLYAMVSPEDVRRYAMMEFLKIKDKLSFTTRNSFPDENGNRVEGPFTFSITETKFKEENGKTTVQIIKKMEDLVQLEKFAASGWKEGMTVTMGYLDELLERLGKEVE